MSECKVKELGVGKRTPNDPLFAVGDVLCRTYVREGIIDIDDEQLCHQIVAAFPCEVLGCSEKFSTLLDFEMHYNSCHRFICSQCRKPLPSAHFLDLHLSESHDSFFAAQAERKPMFRCFVEECSTVSLNVSQRRTHCIEVHSFPHDFRYDQSYKKNKTNLSQVSKSKKESNSEAMSVDEVQEKRPHVMKHFTFGHGTQSKTFTRNNKSWYNQKKPDEKKESTSEITTAELMDTLPS